jgi:hypothetical protein
MAILLKVMWVDRSDQPDPYQRITHIGGSSGKFEWKHTHAQAIQSIEKGVFHYYLEKDGRVLKLEVGMAPNGCKHLKTQDDDDQPQLLLDLPQSPGPKPLGRESSMDGISSFGGYTIPVYIDRKKDGIYGIAICPICHEAEESPDEGQGEKYAAGASIVKIRNHMRLKHGIKDRHALAQ